MTLVTEATPKTVSSVGGEGSPAAIPPREKKAVPSGVASPTIAPGTAPDLTLTVGGQQKYRDGFEPVVPGVRHVPFGDVAALAALLDLPSVQTEVAPSLDALRGALTDSPDASTAMPIVRRRVRAKR